ncbi:MAG: molybdopterin-binding protein, partial [Syntrophobacteraceae bacterium]|nr:molybdopterin-binding protein [Syntrophobacteraceae bacterium]
MLRDVHDRHGAAFDFPLVVKRSMVEEAVRTAQGVGHILSVKPLRKPRAGIVITGNEVYYGRIQDAFAPVIQEKLQPFGGEIVGVHYVPDDEHVIVDRMRALIDAGAGLLITTGGMSVDPDDVTRFAIRSLGASDWTYGSP